MLFDEKVSKFAKQFPTNFKPLIALQRNIAMSNFSYANILMERESFLEAKKLIRRGNDLMSKIHIAESL